MQEHNAQRDAEDLSIDNTSIRTRIAETCDSIRDMLLAKNESYGNSALEPLRIFSKADNVEQLRARIDDKLSRLMRGHDYRSDDTLRDLIGYLILLEIAEGEPKQGFADDVAERMARIKEG
jgi:hypothetical protein